jgi:hypothetical protein
MESQGSVPHGSQKEQFESEDEWSDEDDGDDGDDEDDGDDGDDRGDEDDGDDGDDRGDQDESNGEVVEMIEISKLKVRDVKLHLASLGVDRSQLKQGVKKLKKLLAEVIGGAFVPKNFKRKLPSGWTRENLSDRMKDNIPRTSNRNHGTAVNIPVELLQKQKNGTLKESDVFGLFVTGNIFFPTRTPRTCRKIFFSAHSLRYCNIGNC